MENEMEAVLLTIILVFVGIIALDTKSIKEMLKDAEEDMMRESYKKETALIEPEVTPKKAKIYTPSKDSMGEFSGQHDDWFGDNNE